MPDWLLSSNAITSDTALEGAIAFRLLLAAAYGVVVAVIYRLSHGRLRNGASKFAATLVLLSILIAMVSMVIGDSIAKAFSLVGVLSIVRFRTVVEDTRDTAFVIFAVVVGMAAGAASLFMPAIGIPLVGVVAIGMNRYSEVGAKSAEPIYLLTIRLGLGRDVETVLRPLLTMYFTSDQLVRIETAKQGAAIEATYRCRLEAGAAITAFADELNRTEGIQYVGIRLEHTPLE